MAFPKTIDEMRAASYRFDNHARCEPPRGCGQVIEWWITPRGKKMPMDVDEAGNCKPHWSTCPKAANFRRYTNAVHRGGNYDAS